MKKNIGKKAVLVYPKFSEDTFWSFAESLKRYEPLNAFKMPKRSLPPLGLMGLYRYLNENWYFDQITLFDRNVDPTH